MYLVFAIIAGLIGLSLSVGDVLVFSDGHDGPVARAGLTYSIPPR